MNSHLVLIPAVEHSMPVFTSFRVFFWMAEAGVEKSHPPDSLADGILDAN
jgi:hypothetical protein